MKKLLGVMFLACFFILNIQSVYAGGATPAEAKALVKKAVKLLTDQGDAGLDLISKADGGFYFKDRGLYAFVYDENCVMLAHPYKPQLIGKSYKGKPDVKGKLFRDEIVEMALTKGKGVVTYHYQKPGSEDVFKKLAYCELVQNNDKKYIVVSGVYKKD